LEHKALRKNKLTEDKRDERGWKLMASIYLPRPREDAASMFSLLRLQRRDFRIARDFHVYLWRFSIADEKFSLSMSSFRFRCRVSL
jgi:hypothetical protein